MVTDSKFTSSPLVTLLLLSQHGLESVLQPGLRAGLLMSLPLIVLCLQCTEQAQSSSVQ